ncbi:MAG: secondary thiamine-phosphate synthase enzyme YjbQ [Mariprofundaceae bacterium]
MKQAQYTLSIHCHGRGMIDITGDVRGWVREAGIQTGLLNLFVQHTSCSLMIQENADPDVLRDMEAFMTRLVPDGDPDFHHRAEGPDDMPAHIRMALTQVSLTIPVQDARPALGTWQGIYLYEHRHQPMRRRVHMHLAGA